MSNSDLEMSDMPPYAQRLLQKVLSLESRVTDMQSLLDENASLRQGVAARDAELAVLRSKLAALEAVPASHKTVCNPQSEVPSPIPNPNPNPSVPSYASITNRHLPPTRNRRSGPKPALTERKMESISRPFQETTGPQGFQYLYIPRNRRLERSEVRKRLRKLGLESSRILDIYFPTRSTIGLLVHDQYAQSVRELLAKAKISTLADFDPLDPKHLSDPKFEGITATERAEIAHEIHHCRAKRTLEHIRPTIVSAVARYFCDMGWISEEDMPRHRYHDRDDPRTAAPFLHQRRALSLADDSMSDAPLSQDEL